MATKVNFYENYGDKSARERAELIYSNYSSFQGIIEDCKMRLIYEIKAEKERRRSNHKDELGVRIQNLGNYSNPTADEAVLDVMLELLEKRYDRKPIIYTNSYIYSSYISGRYDDYPVWISDPEISDTLPDGRDWLFCQYTFRGVSENIAGGEKYVDLNVFNGSEWEFRKYSGR